MKLTYQTGNATFIQFAILGILNIATAISSTITSCKDASNCVGSVFINFVYYLVLVGWFGFVTVLGFAAQSKRSCRLAQALIAAECLIAIIALFNATYGHELLGRITSAIDLILAAWIITLAWRLMRAGGGRVVANRARRRPTTRQ